MSAYNGSGTFVITGTGLPYVTATTISSTVANQLNTDLAAGLSTAITKDGQTTPTANIPLGGFKVTGIGVASGTGDALSYGRAATVTTLAATTITASGNVQATSTGAATLFPSGAMSLIASGVTGNYGPNTILNNDRFDIQATSGGVGLAAGATSWGAFSDERLKTGLLPITDGLAKITSLRACTGRYKTDPDDVSRSFLIAQDVQKVLPEAVSVHPVTRMLELRYSEVIPLLVAALAETKDRLEQLENGRP